MGLQILIRESGDVTILDLQGRATIDGGESELLSSRLKQLVANGVRKLLLNLVNLRDYTFHAKVGYNGLPFSREVGHV